MSSERTVPESQPPGSDAAFWRAATAVKLAQPPTRPGLYTLQLTLARPAHVDLEVIFRDEGQPPLRIPLDLAGEGTRYARAVSLAFEPRTIVASVSPPLAPGEQAEFTAQPVATSRALGSALRRGLANLARPRELVRKIRHVVSGTASFSLAPPGATAGSGFDYARWQAAFESAPERARLRKALDAQVPGPRRPFGIVVHTASAKPGLLSDIVEALSQSPGTDAAEPRPSLLVVEAPGQSPLPDGLLERIHTIGGTVIPAPVAHPTTHDVGRLVEWIAANDIFAVHFAEQPGQWHEHAWSAFRLALARDPCARAVYADHDHRDADGNRVSPCFKPAWSPHVLAGCDYIAAPVAFRAVGLDALLTGALPLPAVGTARAALLKLRPPYAPRDGVAHVPRILFTASSAPSGESGEIAVPQQSRWQAQEGNAAAVTSGSPGHAQMSVETGAPRVSVIIPTKDQPVLLRAAVDSVLSARGPEREVVVLDNGSEKPEQTALLDTLRRTEGVKVCEVPQPFNFAALMNRGRREATGDVLVLLNDDIEAIDSSWLAELADLATRPEVGCVGAFLYYPDRTIQHGGVTLGGVGVADHAWRHVAADDPVLAPYGRVVRDVTAVTAACLAVRAEVYDRAGGFDERLAVAFNDVDFCLKVRALGLCNVVTPFAQLVHYESVSRGHDVTPAKLARLAREMAVLDADWGTVLRRDALESPHISLFHTDRRPRAL